MNSVQHMSLSQKRSTSSYIVGKKTGMGLNIVAYIRGVVNTKWISKGRVVCWKTKKKCTYKWLDDKEIRLGILKDFRSEMDW